MMSMILRCMRLSACLLAVVIMMASCSGDKKKSYDEIGQSGLTVRTENMRDNLPLISERGVLFGQMSSTLCGAGWQGDSLRSDIKSVCGDNVAVTGYEISDVTSGTDVSGMSLSAIRSDILSTVQRGSLVIIRWMVPEYLDDEELTDNITSMSNYLASLQDGYGKRAPVLLYIMPRVHDEWYMSLPADDYKNVYKIIADKLRELGTSNIVAGYSAEQTTNEKETFKAYMPDCELGAVDLSVGDINESENTDARWQMLSVQVKALVSVAKSKKCGAGITMGDYCRKDSAYWSQRVLPLIAGNGLTYALFRENSGMGGDIMAACPYPGSSDIADFMHLYNDKRTIFAHNLNGLYLKKKD